MKRSVIAAAEFVVLLLLSLSPHVAMAQDYTVCVAPPGPVPDSCSTRPCDEVVQTGSAAISLAEAYVTANGPGQVGVCIIDTPLLNERIVVDNSNQQLGSPFSINFVGNTLCPESSDAPGEPTIVWTPGELDFLVGVNIDFRPGGACSNSSRPGVDIIGNGSVFITGAFRGTSNYGIQSGNPAGNDGGTQIRNSVISDCEGSAVVANRLTQIYKTQIVGCETTTAGLLTTVGPDGIEFRNSLVAANRAGGAAPALLDGPFNVIENVSFVANIVESGIPLVGAEPFVPRWVLGGSGVEQRSGNSIAHSIFSRNAAVSNLDSLDLGPTPTVPRPQDIETEEVCSDLGYDSWLDSLDLSAADGSSPIIRYSNGGADSLATVFRSAFVGNLTGDAPLVEVTNTEAGLDLQLFQNTAVDNGGVPFLRALDLNNGDRALIARNHVEDLPAIEMAASGDLEFLLISHNSGGTQSDWSPGVVSADVVLLGPTLDPPQWRSPGEIGGQSACAQHRLRCPGHTNADCQDYAARGPLHCAVDRAAELLPVLPVPLDESEAWPWETDYFSAADSSWIATGTSGWRCDDISPAVDSVPSLGFGDGDGFPDLVDCDNEDGGLVATVPKGDGEWCIPNGDDDDDSTNDDDDSTADDDDDSTADDDDDTTSGPDDVPVGCSGKGCGLTFPPASLALVFLLTPVLRRRRDS